jgi:hypothetical protein
MTAFSAAFRDVVVPKLRTEIAIQALHLAYGQQGWSECYGTVIDVAVQRGALYLPEDEWQDLRDWVASRMLRWVDFYEGAGPSPVGRE